MEAIVSKGGSGGGGGGGGGARFDQGSSNPPPLNEPQTTITCTACLSTVKFPLQTNIDVQFNCITGYFIKPTVMISAGRCAATPGSTIDAQHMN